jgi:flavin reductase (DIM6/NTAB) family NADH-FMN oxidoreductase RutF
VRGEVALSGIVGAEDFRRIMSSFPTGVTVITTFDEKGANVGLTANAVSSVSLTPPQLLVCLGVDKYTAAAIRKCGVFAVNFLSAEQRWIAEQFASSKEDKFSGLEIERGELNLPLIKGAIAIAECQLERLIEAGDHLIFIGAVRAGRAEAGNPLMYFKREFGAWHEKARKES